MTATDTTTTPGAARAQGAGRAAAAARVADRRAKAAEHATPRNTLRRRWRFVIALALLGAAIGCTLGFVFPAGFRSDVAVLITRLAATDGNIESALDDEARFVNAVTVRDRVRAGIVDSPNTVDVAIDVGRQVLVITAEGDSPDEALRLARNWSSAFISERRTALISRLERDQQLLDAELDDLITRIGTARLAGNDDDVSELEVRRDRAAAELAAASNDLSALEAGSGAEVIESASMPSGRSGVAMLPASLLGAALGTLTGLLVALLGARRQRRKLEALDWLDPETEGVSDPTDIAASIDFDSSPFDQTPDPIASSPLDVPAVFTGPASPFAEAAAAASAGSASGAADPESVATLEQRAPTSSGQVVSPAVQPLPDVAVPAPSGDVSRPQAVPSIMPPAPAPCAPAGEAGEAAEPIADSLPDSSGQPPTPTGTRSSTPSIAATTLPRPVPDWRSNRTRSLGRSQAPAPTGRTPEAVRIVDLRLSRIEPISDEWADDLALIGDPAQVTGVT